MESSIAEFLKRHLAFEQLPTRIRARPSPHHHNSVMRLGTHASQHGKSSGRHTPGNGVSMGGTTGLRVATPTRRPWFAASSQVWQWVGRMVQLQDGYHSVHFITHQSFAFY